MPEQPTKPYFRANSPVGNWNAVVPVAEDEHKHLYGTGREHNGKVFETKQASVWVTYGSEASFAVSGPNIRQDGSYGAYTVGQSLSRDELVERFPKTWESMKIALGNLATMIRQNAERAVDEIDKAMV